MCPLSEEVVTTIAQPYSNHNRCVVSEADGSVEIKWRSVIGKAYTVQYSTDLVTWEALGDPIPAATEEVSVMDAASPDQATRFYLVRADL